ncbi:MAG: hypothetical protein ACRDQB_03545 [Thermocrispum sp.]
MSRSRQKPSDPGVRVARGWLLAACSAVLSLSAHTAADGTLPDPSLALAIAGLTGWVSTALADRSRVTRSGGMLAVLLTLAAAQLVSHLALAVFGPHHDLAAGPYVDPLTMLAAHAAATLVLAAMIGSAERGLLLVVAGLRRMLPVVVAAGPYPPVAVPAVVARPMPTKHTEVLLRRLHTRRGPPQHS